MKVYISGKMTGLSRERIRRKFEAAAHYIFEQGDTPVNPAQLGITQLDYEDYMKIDFALIDICDSVYMMNDWEESPGAIRELHYALSQGKGVIYE